MSADFEYAVIGGGGMGSSAAYYLAREGKSVVLFEQFEIGHERGSSHGENRIVRYVYEWIDYVKLAKIAYPLWFEAEAESGRKLVNITGGLDLGAPGYSGFETLLAALEAENIDHEVLDGSEIRKRFPQFSVDTGVRGLYQKDAGYAIPDVCVPTFIELAERHGAEIRQNSRVDSISISDNSIELKVGSQTFHSKNLIITVGAWAGPFLDRLGLQLPLSVTLEQYAFFQAATPELLSPERCPVFINHVGPDEATNLYGMPYLDGLGVKVGEHRAGADTTADTRNFEVDPAKLKRLTARSQRLIPDLTGEVTKAATCLYENTSDRHFIIDTLPTHKNVVVACGFSGHGFKFVPAVGAIVRDLLAGKPVPVQLDRFSLGRFAEQNVPVSTEEWV